MNNLNGKQAIFYFESGAELHGTIQYQPVATGDNWIINTDYETLYIQNYSYMCISKSSTTDNNYRLEHEELQAEVEELTGLNNLLLKEHVMGAKISRHTSNETWINWVEACREVEEALSQEDE